MPTPPEVWYAYERVLARASARSRRVEVGTSGRAHLLEKGAGPPVVLLPGGGSVASFFLPLLNELQGIRAIAPDRPGQGLSDPIDLAPERFRQNAVAWLDDLLDALELDTAALVGHSGGAVWALWYALAHPDRVDRLMLIGAPALPKTRCPLPHRLIAIPGLGGLLSRLMPPSPASLLRFASLMGVDLSGHPDLVDLWVATSRDPIADRAHKAELRLLISPVALLSRSGWRGRSCIRRGELRQLATPTLLAWGEHDPLYEFPAARAVTELITHARLEVLAGGHLPWIPHCQPTATLVSDFAQSQGGHHDEPDAHP